MNTVHLLPVGSIDAGLLEDLRSAIPRRLPVGCEVLGYALDPNPSYHAERQQYHSSEILRRMQALIRTEHWRVVAIADIDLYIPILKYVFGEAHMGGPCAVVSIHRLRQEFYGLERDDALLRERLLKETLHELGHTLNLRHCEDYTCVMASSHSVEWVDLRESALCAGCHSNVDAKIHAAATG